MKEMVNHPSHYNIDGRKECIVEIEEKFGFLALLYFCCGNAYKYLYRAGMKDDNSREQDIEKAKWYMNYIGTRSDLSGVEWLNEYKMYRELKVMLNDYC